MITVGKILALLLKLRDAGHNKAGRLRDTLLISSNAVQSATEAHKRTVHQAMNYLTAMRLSRYGLKREEEKERKRLYNNGYKHGDGTYVSDADADLQGDAEWRRGYEAGLRSKMRNAA
jgi:hypothetical protein